MEVCAELKDFQAVLNAFTGGKYNITPMTGEEKSIMRFCPGSAWAKTNVRMNS